MSANTLVKLNITNNTLEYATDLSVSAKLSRISFSR